MLQRSIQQGQGPEAENQLAAGIYRGGKLRIDMPCGVAGRQGHFKMVCILSVLWGRINSVISATLFDKDD
ncbi:hypothetical protein CVS48_09450 [Achromobacter spanius]|nr:hypothetical protein CVS48_09450 [Achromobacter spanius]